MNILTIESLLQAFKQGELTVKDFLTQKYQEAKNDQQNAWISLITESQLNAYIANLEHANIDELPLFGVPFAVKDNIDLEGLPTTAACKEYVYQPEQSAFVVQRLIEAGAVPLGKTNLDQFATGLVGTRSPWGAVKNTFNPEYISGGSSSGSGVTVANNQVLFSLGTDTAGSGRVPAAFNNIYGLKATKGLLSCSGVVPACKSLDCVTLFSKSAQDLETLFDIVAQHDMEDAYSRVRQNTQPEFVNFKGVKIGVPTLEQRAFFGNESYQTAFEQSLKRLEQLGAELVEFNLEPFISAAKLLYQGPWVAERYAAIEDFFNQDSSRCLPVIETILSGAKNYSAADTFKNMYQLQAYKAQCDVLMASVDLVVTPTAGTIHTIEAVNQNPIELNSQLGYYTNFMNLLDYAAIAVPASITDQGLPFGITFFSQCQSDTTLLSLAQAWQESMGLPLGATGEMLNQNDYMPLLVCGAHMQGLPLNWQLTSLGGVLKQKTQTSTQYQMYALAGGPPYRPGMVRNEQEGKAIEVEVWIMPKSSIGALLSMIPAPLGLGSVELASGEWVKGFICEPIGLNGATDITHFGGWRAYMASL
ncbi:MAG: allophanate hydrolase [Vibrio sp.]